ncbi:CoA-binding protein [bacterium]|nr:CoA-binding protein [bacterium]
MESVNIVDELRPLFNPTSVAVVGASNNSTKWGYTTFSNLANQYKGMIYAVNNRESEVQGHQAYTTLTDIPGNVDLAVIVVPAEIVAEVVTDCVSKRVKAAVIISAGFAETGSKGKAMQDEVLKIAQKGGIRLVGPNCMGMWSAPANLPAFMFPMKIEKGPLALISQGGNIGSAIVADSTARGIGYQQYVSCGCTADIQIEDYIEYAGLDDSVKVILVYIEGLNDGARFVEKVSAITRKKPVIVVKPGRTDAAARAISSHSGALSGTDSVYEAAFKKAGVLRVDTSTELLDVAIAFLRQPLPKGRNLVVTTPGGSYGVMAADACALRGLNMIDLPDRVMAEFNTMFPPRWSHGNPVDPAGDRDVVQYMKAPEILLKCDEVDALIFMGFGSFSGITSVFASGDKSWSFDDLKMDVTEIEKLALSALQILDSGDKIQIKGLLQSILNITLGPVLATKAEELDSFADVISTALTTEKMMERSFFINLRQVFRLIANGQTGEINMDTVVSLVEPIIDALLEKWIDDYGKPVITTTFTEGTVKISEAGFSPYPNSERAATVLAKLLEYAEYLDRQ